MRIRILVGLLVYCSIAPWMACECDQAKKSATGVSIPTVKGDLFAPATDGNAVMLAPGFINTGLYERDVAMSPDGNTVYYGLITGHSVLIMETVRGADGVWSEPRVAPFATDERYHHLEPCLSMDGNRVFFLSTAPPPGMDPKPGWGHQNIWTARRLDDGAWSQPELLGPPVDTDDGEFFPSVTKDGTLYFTRQAGGRGPGKIYRSRLVDGGYGEPEPLPETVNRYTTVYNATIHPDETYLVACVNNREDDSIQPGYYVFFRSEDDRWSEGVRLPESINVPGEEPISINVSTDGKWLFFASAREQEAGPDRTRLSGILEMAMRPGNGRSDIYVISADVVETLRPAGW